MGGEGTFRRSMQLMPSFRSCSHGFCACVRGGVCESGVRETSETRLPAAHRVRRVSPSDGHGPLLPLSLPACDTLARARVSVCLSNLSVRGPVRVPVRLPVSACLCLCLTQTPPVPASLSRRADEAWLCTAGSPLQSGLSFSCRRLDSTQATEARLLLRATRQLSTRKFPRTEKTP